MYAYYLLVASTTTRVLVIEYAYCSMDTTSNSTTLVEYIIYYLYIMLCMLQYP